MSLVRGCVILYVLSHFKIACLVQILSNFDLHDMD